MHAKDRVGCWITRWELFKKMTYLSRSARKGFTLIEILTVVVILGILAAIVVPQFTNAADDASISSARTQLQSMRSQIELFYSQNGAYPADATWKTQLNSGGYLRSATVDWPASFTEVYASGALSLTYSGSGDVDGDGTGGTAADIAEVAAW